MPRPWNKFKNKRLRRKWRGQLLRQQKYLCGICGLYIPRKAEVGMEPIWEITFDHMLPKAQGGKNLFNNLRVVHARCNTRKAGKAYDDIGARRSYHHNPPKAILKVLSTKKKERHPKNHPGMP